MIALERGGGSRTCALLLAALAIACGAAAGALAASGSSVIHLDVTWSAPMAIAALVGILALALIAARPMAGIALLLVLAFSNASEILVREHGMPSILQLLVPILLAVLLASPSRSRPLLDDATRGFRPDLAFLAATACWLAVLLLSSTWAWDRDAADDTIETTIKAAMLAIVCGWAIPSLSALGVAAWTTCATGAALSALSSYQVLGDKWDESFWGFARIKQAQIAGTDLGPRATGPLADPNFYAQALLPLVPLAIALALGARSRLARLLAWGLAAIVALGIVTTYSRGGALALFLELALFAWVERRRIRAVHVALALVLLAAGAAMLPTSFFVRRLETLTILLPSSAQPVEQHDSSVAKRRVLMAAAAAMAEDHPILGVGAGNYGTHFEDYASRVGAQARIYHDPGERAFAHSLPLEIAAENGLLGLVALGSVVLCALVAVLLARSRLRRAGDERGELLARAVALGLVGTLTSSLILHGDYPRYTWLVLGFAVAAWRGAAREPVAA